MATVSNGWLAARWIAILFLLWDLAGLAAFVAQWTADLAALARTDPYQARMFSEMPGWLWTDYAVAVLFSIASAVLLILRRKGAVILAALALIAVLIQFGYTFGVTDVIAVRGIATAAALPAAIIILSVLQLLYANWLAGKGLLR